MNVSPQISCIITFADGTYPLARVVKSVLDQGPGAQAVLVGAFSGKEAAAIAARTARSDPRVIALPQPPGGGAGQYRRIGVEAAGAPIVTFLEAGDEHVVGWYRHAVGMLAGDPNLAAVTGETVLMNRPAGNAVAAANSGGNSSRSPRWCNVVMRKVAYRLFANAPQVPAAREGDEWPLHVVPRQALVRSERPAVRHYPESDIAIPNPAVSLNERGRTLLAAGAPREALECFERAMSLGMHGLDLATLHSNRATVLHRLNRTEEALAGFNEALRIVPDLPLALCGRGLLLQDLGLLQEARTSFERALALQPDFAIARLNLGMTCLAMGDWREGWEHYESRWEGSHEAGIGRYARPQTALPLWKGQTETGADGLLVFAEQGLGDVIQMARYLPLVAQRFARLSVVMSQSPLIRLFRESFSPDIEFLNAIPKDQSAWQWQCPTLSLPRAFGTTVDNVPAEIPYLRARAEWAELWRSRFDRLPAGHLKVGLAWAGDGKHKSDAKRSLDLHRLAPLLRQENVAWVSLQKGGVAGGVAATPDALPIADWMSDAHDMADTAGLISLLDLVITVDTSIVHLACALGKPVWMFNRFEGEWRWIRGRNDSPWYPGLRIFTQDSAGDWVGVIRAVGNELAMLQLANRAD